MQYDKEYYNSLKKKYDIAHPDFSLSDDTRWTVESLYQAMLDDMDSIEIAE